MSWVPVLKLGGNSPSIKNGNISSITSDGITLITFSKSFSDSNYTVSITPYSDVVQSSSPQAYLLFDNTFTSTGFTVKTSNATGFFWTAMYGSNS